MIIYYTDGYTGGRDESRRLLAEAIAEYTGDRAGAAALTAGIRTGENGKPYIDGFDFFSVSHTGKIWAVLFCEAECGLDIQLARKCDALSISKRFYDPDDAAAVASLYAGDPQNGEDGFFRIWARREALVKAAGGSIADSSIPSVLGDSVIYGGAAYAICDILIPDIPDVFAAVCIKGDAAPEIRTFQKIV